MASLGLVTSESWRSDARRLGVEVFRQRAVDLIQCGGSTCHVSKVIGTDRRRPRAACQQRRCPNTCWPRDRMWLSMLAIPSHVLQSPWAGPSLRGRDQL